MISTTILKKYFDEKMKDLDKSGFFLEFKEVKQYWITRLSKYNSNHDDLNVPIMFLIGQKVYKFTAISIWVVHRDFIPKKYINAITTEFAYCIKCVRTNDQNICN